MDIVAATKNYEAWMRQCIPLVESDLRSKHQQMKDDPFLFFRGTFYRWAQLFPTLCAELARAPRVIACADLHVGSFGTWRDFEGRLCWGVDDFDEAYPLAYTNDLVRLAASVKTVIDSGDLEIKLRDGCDMILEGYEQGLKRGGCPFVLAEHAQHLEKLGVDALNPPPDFWETLNDLPAVRGSLPRNLKSTFEKMMPEPGLDYKIAHRQAGLGSLGQPRYVAIAVWEGGCIAREAKAMVPSSCAWEAGGVGPIQHYYRKALAGAVRSRDPFQKIVGTWLMRRLSPDSNPIEITDLNMGDEEVLLHAMGSEAANVHLGSKRAVRHILRDLRRRKGNWLRSAAKQMAKAMEGEWKEYAKA
jgi:hypothetical protein